MATSPDNYAGTVLAADDGGLGPRKTVLLGAGVSVGRGYAIVEVAGYGQHPAAANASTGKCAGVTMDNVDNAGGAAGAASVGAEGGTRDFKNSSVNPCTQADVGKAVYGEAYDTVGNLNTAGPPLGKLVSFGAVESLPGYPCRVRLNVDLT